MCRNPRSQPAPASPGTNPSLFRAVARVKLAIADMATALPDAAKAAATEHYAQNQDEIRVEMRAFRPISSLPTDWGNDAIQFICSAGCRTVEYLQIKPQKPVQYFYVRHDARPVVWPGAVLHFNNALKKVHKVLFGQDARHVFGGFVFQVNTCSL